MLTFLHGSEIPQTTEKPRQLCPSCARLFDTRLDHIPNVKGSSKLPKLQVLHPTAYFPCTTLALRRTPIFWRLLETTFRNADPPINPFLFTIRSALIYCLSLNHPTAPPLSPSIYRPSQPNSTSPRPKKTHQRQNIARARKQHNAQISPITNTN